MKNQFLAQPIRSTHSRAAHAHMAHATQAGPWREGACARGDRALQANSPRQCARTDFKARVKTNLARFGFNCLDQAQEGTSNYPSELKRDTNF
jgi:hypothetical protein